MKRFVGGKWSIGTSCLLVVSMAAVCGCGGGRTTTKVVKPTGSHQVTIADNRKARAKFVIHWPKKATRAIPANTNRIIIYIHADDIKGALAYIADKPAYSDSTSLDVDIPAGTKRQFAVEARQVPQTNQAYITNPTAVPYDNIDLRTGTVLGGGNDLMAHDIGVGETVTATVVVSEPGTPATGTTGIAVTINQVLATAFPSVLVLQLIRDQNGNPISNLNSGNFTVTEDNIPVDITDVRTVQQAASNLSVALVLDRSGSMADAHKNEDLEPAASQFVSLLQTNDYAEIINFNDSVDVTQPFTNDKSLLTKAIQGRVPSGNTALYDAIYQGVSDTAARGGRMAILALTDGIENASSHSQADVIQNARNGGLPIFTIGLGADADSNGLSALATPTGGIYTPAPSASNLKSIYTTIASQLNGQIQLSFISPDPTASGHSRHVVVDFHYGTFTGHQEYDYFQ